MSLEPQQGPQTCGFGGQFSLALAVHKGRARSFDILRITQQVAALSIAGGFSVRLRWIASEHNVADGPSRGQIEPGPYRPGDRETVKTECEEDAVESGEGDCSTFKAGGEKAPIQPIQIQKLEGGNSFDEVSSSSSSEGWSDPCIVGGQCGLEGAKRETHCSGGAVSVRRSAVTVTVSGLLREVREFLPGQQVGLATKERGGSHSCRFLGRDVLREPFRCRRRKGGSCNRVFQSTPEGDIVSLQESLAGVEERETSSEQIAVATDDCRRNGDDPLCLGKTPHVFETHGGSRHVFETWRKHRSERSRHRSSSSQWGKTIPLVFNSGEGLPGSQARQDGSLRQLGAFEQCGARVPRTASLGKGSGAEWEGREGLSIRRCRIPKELSRGWSAAGIQEFASVPKQARRCIGRLEQWRKRSSCCQGSGQVAHGPKCAKIWKGGENSMMTDLSPERMAFCQWSLRNIERVLKGTLPPRLP